MVDNYGRWIPENDYSTYPKEKWCDYDRMAFYIMENGYKPKVDMETLISNMFSEYEDEIGYHASEFDAESGNFNGTYTDACKAFVDASGGIKEFDYEY